VSSCSPLGFQLSWTTRPIELGDIQMDLLGGWMFSGLPVTATDLFGPFPGLGPGSVSYGGAGGGGFGFASLQIDFLAALYGTFLTPVPPCAGPPLFCEGFAVAQEGSFFDPPTWVSAGLTAPTTGEALSLTWRATDIDGTPYEGTVDQSMIVGTVVPEPSTWILLGTGLLGIGFTLWRRRREEEGAEAA
jgi:PEP-CTERM motif-containing protein